MPPPILIYFHFFQPGNAHRVVLTLLFLRLHPWTLHEWQVLLMKACGLGKNEE
jgi:hypothetical protein